MAKVNKAKARLNKAAPKLLEALSELSDIVQGILDERRIDGLIDSFTLQPARAAIAEATGE